jgi:hypothetical protein
MQNGWPAGSSNTFHRGSGCGSAEMAPREMACFTGSFRVTGRQVKVDDRSAWPHRRTVVLHPLRISSSPGTCTPTLVGHSTATAHPAAEGRTSPARPGQRSPRTPSRSAHRWGSLTHSSRDDSRIESARAHRKADRLPARSACPSGCRGLQTRRTIKTGEGFLTRFTCRVHCDVAAAR